ncbi:MAG: DNA repair exonuclease [Candidatus Aenigmarchaeota archaeon]|nr:DNA repair exonuclease [Candidatus Aenigmarchaeota archaeon]
MKVSIFSDCHCGFAYGEERGEDSFIALNESIEKSMDSDLILIAGDLFDSRVPRPEIFAKTARILSKAQHIPTNTKLVDLVNKRKEDISPLALRGVPIVSIHGTHERRTKYMVNPIQALEHAGLLIHLHCGTAVFDVNGEKVAVHGMSGVPERYAGDVLSRWNPRPIEGAKNILMIHQSVDPYIYSPLDPPTIKLEDFPDGFDLYILGHIHWTEQKPLKSGTILVAGSTTYTSLHKHEMNAKKSIYKYDGSLLSIPLEKQRNIYWSEFDFSSDIVPMIESKLNSLPNIEPKPIAVFKIKGIVPKEMTMPNFSELENRYSGKAIVKITKKLKAEKLEEQIELINKLREQKLSPEEQGLRILQENLKQVNCGLNVEEMFEMLVNGETENIYNLLIGKKSE